MKIPLENTLEDSSRIVLGWKPLFIENHMLSLITPQSKELILGPGKSLSFDTLFELSTKSTDTKAILDFEINMTNIINREQVLRNMNASNLGASALGRKQGTAHSQTRPQLARVHGASKPAQEA